MDKQLVTLYIVRHGKTMLNTADRVQGWADSPLTQAGVEVAIALGKGLQIEKISFDAVYSSDSGRAIETAEIVLHESGYKDLAFIKNKQLREVNFGKYEGDLNATMWNDITESLKIDSMKDIGRFGIPRIVDTIAALDETKQAENWEKVSFRVKESINEIANKQAEDGGGNVLIVTHGMTIGALLAIINPSNKSRGLDNASVTKIEYADGTFKVKSIGDMSYVEKGRLQVTV